jgi:hypothetical protein
LILRDPAGLFPKRYAGRGRDTADDDVADLALGMTTDDMDGLGRAHAALNLSEQSISN